MKKKLYSFLLVLCLIALSSRYSIMAETTVNWNGDEPNFAIQTKAVIGSKENASGVKITSNAHSSDFGGIYLSWISKQKEDGYLKIVTNAFDEYSSYILTAKESNTYWDWEIKPQPNQKIYTDSENSYYIFCIPKLNKNINMFFITPSENETCKHGSCKCCEIECTCKPFFDKEKYSYKEAYAGKIIFHDKKSSGTTGDSSLRSRPANAFGIPDAKYGSNDETRFYSVNFGDIVYGFTGEGKEQDIYNNPYDYDIALTEVTWDGQWYLEGVKVYLINAVLEDGTTVPEMFAGMAFNRAALTVAKENSYVKKYASQNKYDILIDGNYIDAMDVKTGTGYNVTQFNFPPKVVKASAVKLKDCTKEINEKYSYPQYNMLLSDGYDIDSIKAWWTLPSDISTYSPCCECCTCINCLDETPKCTVNLYCCVANIACVNFDECKFTGCKCVCKFTQ